MVSRRSFHICGWRFPGFSEVNAGSARCHQIRFTSDLSNRPVAYWLPLLPPANAASWTLVLEWDGSPNMFRGPAAPCHKSLPFEAATARQSDLDKGAKGQECLGAGVPKSTWPALHGLSPHIVPDELPQLGGLVPACKDELHPLPWPPCPGCPPWRPIVPIP